VITLLLWAGVVCAEPAIVRIAVGSCAHQDSSLEIWSAVSAWKPDLFVHLGDAVYADTRDSTKLRTIYQQVSRDEHFAAAQSEFPFLSTWDDHDFGENDAGAAYPMRATSERLFFEFWSRQATDARTSRSGVYGSRVVQRGGQLVRVILLDTRYFRSAWSPDTSDTGRRYRQDPDASKTILGEAQWAWLREEITKPADVRIIASSIQVVNDSHGWECWGNFPAERARLLNLIEGEGVDGVIVVSGDRHFSELSREDEYAAYPLYDYTSSGLTQIARDGHRVPNPRRVGQAVARQNFGGVVIDFDNGTIVFSAMDRKGAVVFEHAVSLDTLILKSGDSVESR
jgi:alkaline phosphatase D